MEVWTISLISSVLVAVCVLLRRILRAVPLHELLTDIPASAASVDEWLSARDEAAAPLQAGCQSTVHWANGKGVKTEVCVIYLHGWAASPPELDPVDERIAKAMGANLLRYRYTAHALSPSQNRADEPEQRAGTSLLEEQSHVMLRRDAATAYEYGRLLGERIVIVGCSTGGLLATWLSKQPWVGAELRALVLVSPYFRLAALPSRAAWLVVAWLLLLLPRQVSRRLLGAMNGGPLKRPPSKLPGARGEAQERCWTRFYPVEAVLHIIGLSIHVETCRRSPVALPVLAFACPADPAVSFAATREMVHAMPRGELEVMEQTESTHVITGAIACPSTVDFVVERAVAFLSKRLS
jgi:pimeloyl-ACP methyl ester carboxylesterase